MHITCAKINPLLSSSTLCQFSFENRLSGFHPGASPAEQPRGGGGILIHLIKGKAIASLLPRISIDITQMRIHYTIPFAAQENQATQLRLKKTLQIYTHLDWELMSFCRLTLP